MSLPKKVYLAGGQQYARDKGVGWRDHITPKLNELGFVVFDPTKHEDAVKGKYGDTWEDRCVSDIGFRFTLGGELIDFDFKILQESSAMLVYWDESAVRGGGTKSEITWSRQLGIPCYVVLAEGFTIHDLPLWPCGGIRDIHNVHTSFESFLKKFRSDFDSYISFMYTGGPIFTSVGAM